MLFLKPAERVGTVLIEGAVAAGGRVGPRITPGTAPGSGAPWSGSWGSPWAYAPSSGNRAFDEYRADTFRRLEEEQREFREFLERLRLAKDRAEFDQFMAERRNRQTPDVSQAQT